MRGKSIFIIMLAAFIAIIGTDKLHAEDKGSVVPHTAISNYEHNLQGEGQQFEDFEPDYNPKAREMYGGYKREGTFKLQINHGDVLNATAILVKWESQGNSSTTQYFMVNGSYVKRGTVDISRELNTYAPQPFVLKKDMNYVYSEPFDENLIKGAKVKAGTYSSTRSSVDFVEIALEDGSKVWINPQYTPDYETTQNGYFLNSVVSLNETTINGVPLYQKMMPVRDDKRTGYPMKPSYVTIHNTGSPGSGADALAHAKLQINDNRTFVSWHFTVDNKSIYQSMPMNEVGWHAGDGFYNGNGASIGIEICENADGNYAQGEKNAAYLAAHILYANGLPSDAIRMHYDWSGKDCPYNIIHGTKGSMGWENFKQTVKTEYDRLVSEHSQDLSTTIPDDLKHVLATNGISFDQGYISGFDPDKTLDTVKSVIAGYDAKAVIVMNDSNGKEIAGTTPLATGQQLLIKKEDETKYRMDIVLFGDVNGDGKIGATDLYFLKNHIIKKNILQGSFYKAALVDKTSAGATSLYKIKLDIIGKEKIQQR